MQIHVLIPIPHPTYPGPDPPENVFHFTTGTKLRSIINSGCIKPNTAKIEPHEKPIVFTSKRRRQQIARSGSQTTNSTASSDMWLRPTR